MKYIALALLLATPAFADEVWNSNMGQVVYQADLGTTAVLTVPFGAETASLYVPGLGGNADHRGVHHGYWIATGAGPCEATLTGPDGTVSNNWGRLTVVFDQPVYPGGFTAPMGVCLDEPATQLRATF